ncbi:Uncharacterized membrane protein YcaP, DUF421 family [Paenibacillus algorifonticola]|uniref:Uncharacterized membrane protein YcaP, DUF421 family n=1 Tax=Paenibacillus algorifonticola TaxID=684063 RepID=A0A1I2CT83_9BACL|nr:DUF421 domain-containing protein [Paenibacillus algorifonticola]SFE71546.1 Uncharacterized membrane protein YcaP, DUF421 family [Paenibacillus algorifonticola]
MQDWLEIVIRTLTAVIILFTMTKVLGKRQISQLSLFEYITGITMGNIAAYVSLDLDNEWYLGLLALSVWVAVSVGFEFATLKSKKLRDFIDGRATVLIERGILLRENLFKERLTIDELLEQLRKKDVFRVADVEFAIMEQSGEINVMLKQEQQPLTPNMLGLKINEESEPKTVVMDGNILEYSLRSSGRDSNWLKKQLRDQKMKVEDVFLGQIDGKGELSVQTGEKTIEPAKPKDPKTQMISLMKQFETELKLQESLSLNELDKSEYQKAIHKLQALLDRK